MTSHVQSRLFFGNLFRPQRVSNAEQQKREEKYMNTHNYLEVQQGIVGMSEIFLPMVSPKQVPYAQSVISDLQSYNWFSVENFQRAGMWYEKALTIYQSGNSNGALKGAARQALQFLFEAMVDLYHNDRALCAVSQVKPKTCPIRINAISENISKSGVWYKREIYSLIWSPDIPTSITDILALVSAAVLPDNFLLVKYERMPDPIIYALYGLPNRGWYVKIGEWV